MTAPTKGPYFIAGSDAAVVMGWANECDVPDNSFCCLLRRNEDESVTFIGCDGGAPEDQTLNRDWSWVCDALNAEAAR